MHFFSASVPEICMPASLLPDHINRFLREPVPLGIGGQLHADSRQLQLKFGIMFMVGKGCTVQPGEEGPNRVQNVGYGGHHLGSHALFDLCLLYTSPSPRD